MTNQEQFKIAAAVSKEFQVLIGAILSQYPQLSIEFADPEHAASAEFGKGAHLALMDTNGLARFFDGRSSKHIHKILVTNGSETLWKRAITDTQEIVVLNDEDAVEGAPLASVLITAIEEALTRVCNDEEFSLTNPFSKEEPEESAAD